MAKAKKQMGRRSNFEGSITFHKATQKFMGRVLIGKTEEGNPKYKTIYGLTEQEVLKAMTAIKADVFAGTFTEASKLTVAQWLDIWLKDYKKLEVKPKTYSSYYEICKSYLKPEIGAINLKDLQAPQVQRLINSITTTKGLSPRTAKLIHLTLKMAISQAVKSGLFVKNVCDATTLPRQIKHAPRVLTVEEQDTFLQAINPHRLYPAFYLDLFTGLRVGELLALRWSDVDFDEEIITVGRNVQRIRTPDESSKTRIIFGSPKTESGNRKIPLLDEVTAALKQHRIAQMQERLKAGSLYENNDLVFATELGKVIEPRNFQRLFDTTIESAGLPEANLHSLRHTFATRGLENGIELKCMQELLGHSSITITADIYSHVLPDKKREAINKLRHLAAK